MSLHHLGKTISQSALIQDMCQAIGRPEEEAMMTYVNYWCTYVSPGRNTLVTNLHYNQVKANVSRAQEKQKKEFDRKVGKGVRTFELKPGDDVLKRNMRNTGRKGGKLEPLWSGPYRYFVFLSLSHTIAVCQDIISANNFGIFVSRSIS